ncbi:hypothetical protein C8J57DRAFT_1503774 [Mycena rebaudengoi]|nr:hypothetical protein C8J57DRAFT_1503774 [Mycena rebaudengoi]
MRSFFTVTFLLGLLTHFALAVPVESDETYPLWLSVEVPENGTVLHVVSPSNATLRAPVAPRALQIGRITWATWLNTTTLPI